MKFNTLYLLIVTAVIPAYFANDEPGSEMMTRRKGKMKTGESSSSNSRPSQTSQEEVQIVGTRRNNGRPPPGSSMHSGTPGQVSLPSIFYDEIEETPRGHNQGQAVPPLTATEDVPTQESITSKVFGAISSRLGFWGHTDPVIESSPVVPPKIKKDGYAPTSTNGRSMRRTESTQMGRIRNEAPSRTLLEENAMAGNQGRSVPPTYQFQGVTPEVTTGRNVPPPNQFQGTNPEFPTNRNVPPSNQFQSANPGLTAGRNVPSANHASNPEPAMRRNLPQANQGQSVNPELTAGRNVPPNNIPFQSAIPDQSMVRSAHGVKNVQPEEEVNPDGPPPADWGKVEILQQQPQQFSDPSEPCVDGSEMCSAGEPTVVLSCENRKWQRYVCTNNAHCVMDASNSVARCHDPNKVDIPRLKAQIRGERRDAVRAYWYKPWMWCLLSDYLF